MATSPFIGEIRTFSFNFPPKGWAFCNGQLLPVNQNQALFSILGTFYGGNGTTNFALPNLQGRVPLGSNGTYPLGANGGETSVTLNANQMPLHIHVANGSTTATSASPANTLLPGTYPNQPGYATDASQPTPLAPASINSSGGGQPHTNIQPLLVLNMCIALVGIYPSRN